MLSYYIGLDDEINQINLIVVPPYTYAIRLSMMEYIEEAVACAKRTQRGVAAVVVVTLAQICRGQGHSSTALPRRTPPEYPVYTSVQGYVLLWISIKKYPNVIVTKHYKYRLLTVLYFY